MFKRIFFIISIFVTFLFVSCTDTTPIILSVNTTLVYEYQSETDSPTMRLSVFVQPDTEPERFQKIDVINIETGYIWTITDAQVISVGEKNYIGCTTLRPYNSGFFPLGQYNVIYTDIASRSDEMNFELKNPQSFETQSISSFSYSDIEKKQVAKEFIFDRVALYDENEDLIYYGGQKQNLSKVEEIRRYYSNARTMRRYRMVSGNTCGILLAPVPLPEIVGSNSIDYDEEE